MALTAKQRFELKKFVKELEQYRGRHTELVTVYVPSGYDINKIIGHLKQEQGTATNIKSTSTRKNGASRSCVPARNPPLAQPGWHTAQKVITDTLTA